MKWNSVIDKYPDKSDNYYLVVLHGKFVTISYFYRDSIGCWWSSQWEVWDRVYSEGEVTHWAEIPKLPDGKRYGY